MRKNNKVYCDQCSGFLFWISDREMEKIKKNKRAGIRYDSDYACRDCGRKKHEQKTSC